MRSSFANLSVRKRLWLIVAISVCFIALIEAVTLHLLHDSLWQEKQRATRQLVESTRGILDYYHGRQTKGMMSEEAAKAAALATLRVMRYDDREYFWVNDLGTPFPRMVMHPTIPSLDGGVLDAKEFTRPVRLLGQSGDIAEGSQETGNIFAAFVEVANRSGAGYVAYDWPKPAADGGATEQLFTKLSYIEKFEPWGWVVGSGIYVDDVDRYIERQAIGYAVLVAAIGAVLLLLTAAMARGILRPLHSMLTTLRAIGWGKGNLKHRLVPGGPSEIAELAGGINQMLARIRSHEAELRRHERFLESEVARRTAELKESNSQLESELQEGRRKERELHENRARMRALIDATSEAVMLLGAEGTILEINAFGAQRFGMSPAAMQGKNFFDLIPPDLAASRRAQVSHVAATGEALRSQDRRGSIHFDNSLYPVTNERGEVESVAVFAKDITEQQKAQEIENVFRHLDAMLLKWQMNVESVVQMFCDGILPIFDLVAAWVGKVEKDGGLRVLAGAEVGGQGFIRALAQADFRADGGGPEHPFIAAAMGRGSRQPILFEPEPFMAQREMERPEGAVALLLLPIVLRDKSWGVLALYGRNRRQLEDAPNAVVRLASMAGRLGVVLESAQQQEWLTLLDSALAGVSNAVMITDEKARIVWANESLSRLTGYRSEELLEQTPRLFNSGLQEGGFYGHLWETIEAGKPWRGEIINRRRDGSRYTAIETVTPLFDAGGRISHYIAVLEDISEHKAMEERIRHTANFDLLTDLPNRRLFFDRLGQAVALARRGASPLALLFLDLDRFKEINDSLGHDAGDAVLKMVADRLRGLVRETDTVARLAGDEFTVILPGAGDAGKALGVARKIIDAIALPFALERSQVSVGVSIGVALFPEHGEKAEQLLNAADKAMYLAKNAGRNTVCVAPSEAAMPAFVGRLTLPAPDESPAPFRLEAMRNQEGKALPG